VSFLIIMVLLLVVMYVLMIRPQRQRQQQQQAMIERASVGDDVLTTGGIYGTVTEAEGDEPPDRSPSRTTETPRNVAARSRWARLLARIYEVFPLRCPGCGADMRILAFLTEPEPVQAILRHLARRDPDAVEKAAVAHVHLFRERVQALLESGEAEQFALGPLREA